MGSRLSTLRSGDIRVVLKDTKAKEQALAKGSISNARVLRQEFPVEIASVPLRIKIHHGKEAEARNRPLITEINKDNRFLPTGAIIRSSWLHGEHTVKTANTGKQRSSVILYLATEALRDKKALP